MTCQTPFDPAPDAVNLARLLLGAELRRGACGGTIIETEAYRADDPASHSHSGPSRRNRAMFGPAGHVYIYRSYGIHLCLNVVGRPGEAVLLRALAPRYGIETMRERRGDGPLCAGPGRLCQALGVSIDEDGLPFDGQLYSLTLHPRPSRQILVGPRIGISKAADYPWRFGLADAGQLSHRFPPQGGPGH